MARLSLIRSTRVTVSSTSTPPATAIAMDSNHPLAVHDLAQACGSEIEWVAQLVDAGIVEASPRDGGPDDWRFGSADLTRALEARRLERDFGVELDAAALILELQHEIRRLRAVLHTRGLGDA